MTELAAADLAHAQRLREPLAMVVAESKVARIRNRQTPREVGVAFKKATKATKRNRRIRLILQAVDQWAEPVASLAACRLGCTHCCHLPVAITGIEARLLSNATGRAAVFPTHLRSLSDHDEGSLKALEARDPTPCPFLAGDRCSAYTARPIACRLHFNLDDDDLLCRIVPGQPAQVPYANVLQIEAVALGLLSDELVGDIRDFFPQG